MNEEDLESVRLDLLKVARKCYLKSNLVNQSTSIQVGITVTESLNVKKLIAKVICPVAGCSIAVYFIPGKDKKLILYPDR